MPYAVVLWKLHCQSAFRVTDRGQVSYWLLKFCHLVVLTAVNHKLRSSSKLPLLCYLPTFEFPPKLGKV